MTVVFPWNVFCDLLARHVAVKIDPGLNVLLQVSRRRLLLKFELGVDCERRSMCVREWSIDWQNPDQ